MSLRPGLLRLTLNLALIIKCLSRNVLYFFVFNFTCPLRRPRVPLWVRIPEAEDHCSTQKANAIAIVLIHLLQNCCSDRIN
jgi:hypothetical protein